VNLSRPWFFWRDSGAAGAALSALAGLACLLLPLGGVLIDLSYDLPFFFRADRPVAEAVILYMDDQSEALLDQGPWEKWDRSIHAALLNQLAKLGPRMVVFDVLFSPRGTNLAANARLVQAAKDFGKVLVGAKPEPISLAGEIIGWSPPEGPFQELAEVAVWGLAEGVYETTAVREHFRDLANKTPTLAWRVAEAARSKDLPEPTAERWINYYGPPGWVANYNYADVLLATNLSSWMVLSNKVVFVGARRSVGFTGGKNIDEYRTPYTRWTGRRSPGVEITATVALNLMHGDWLRRLPPGVECLSIVVLGALLGLGLAGYRPIAGLGWGLLTVMVVSTAAVILVWRTGIWYPWMIVVGAQVPCALGWSVLTQTKRLLREKAILEQKLVLASVGETPSMVEPEPARVQEMRARSVAAAARPSGEAVVAEPAAPPALAAAHRPHTIMVALPAIPDHELLSCVGQGAYGEVWLARDILGTFHAVKIVYRTHFPDPAPYEREFNGLKRFTPISRAHPGLVNILHVGRNPDPEYIYYIMEVGDDQATGQNIDPANYRPKSLAQELKQRRPLPLPECLQLGVDLAGALDFLHQHHLLHRDIKPSNIMYVHGVPKLADIGLVTEITARGSDLSYVGTPGYIPPEGPSTPAADIFSLGKVIYEAAFGMNVRAFPELPPALLEQAAGPALSELNQIVLQACEPDLAKRFQSVAALQAALAALLQRLRGETGNGLRLRSPDAPA
jgi:CHASE2 domain-containing sensor protein